MLAVSPRRGQKIKVKVMTKLSQIVAVEPTVKKEADRELTNLYHALQKSDLLQGISRTYRKINDDDPDLPGESKMPQVSIASVLSSVAEQWTRMIDVTATKDWANQSASADVKIDGTTIIASAPVPFLLWMEKQLTDLRTILGKIQTLDPTVEWEYDPNVGSYKSETVTTTRATKIKRNHVLAEATDKHPAQVQVFEEDKIVGYWDTVKFSGALPADKLKLLLERVTELQIAVKTAREEANASDVTQQKVGAKIFDFLLAGMAE